MILIGIELRRGFLLCAIGKKNSYFENDVLVKKLALFWGKQ